jgi:tetratricopeptide (TPR) repeat protein
VEQGVPVLLLIAARPEEAEADSAFERWLSSLGRRLPVRSLTLGPLRDEVVEGLFRQLARAGSSSRPTGALEGVGGPNGEESELKLPLNHLAIPTFQQEADLPNARALLEEARRVAEEAGLKEAVAETECNLVDLIALGAGDMQGRLREGIRIAREALGISRELPDPAEAIGLSALSSGLVVSGEYEEALELGRRATEMARKLPNVLWRSLDHLGRAYEALLVLQEARRVHEEALKLTGRWGCSIRCYP